MDERSISRPMEILLVEDSLVDARFTMVALKQVAIRHRLTLVCDGEEAIAFLLRKGVFARAPRPDLVLLDLLMPKMNGLEVLAKIREDENLRIIPVVVLTAALDEAFRIQCEFLGVDGYIAKPVELRKFLQIVRDLRNHWRSDLVLPALE